MSPTPVTLVNASFDSNANGFVYVADAFGTHQASHESGSWSSTGGSIGGGLQVSFGSAKAMTISGMSAGWEDSFNLVTATDVTLTFQYKLTQTPNYATNEFSQVLVSIDGTLVGTGGHTYVDQITGDGSGGSSLTTGWQTVTLDLGVLSAGTHTLILGGYNNLKHAVGDTTTVNLDNVTVATNPGGQAASAGASAPMNTAADGAASHPSGLLSGENAGGSHAASADATANGETESACGSALKPSDVLDFHSDGIHSDGIHSDGIHSDGIHTDGIHTDGIHTDGIHTDGIHTDGIHTDGIHADDDHGHPAAPSAAVAPPVFAAPDLLASLFEHAQAAAQAAHAG